MKPTRTWPLLVLPLVAASEYCLDACRHALQATVVFNDAPDAPWLLQACVSRNAATGTYLCLDEGCPDDGEVEALLREACWTALQVDVVGKQEALEGWTEERRRRVRRVAVGERVEADEVVVPDAELFWRWYGTLDAVGHVHFYHYWYGWAMGFYWIAVLGIAATFRLVVSTTTSVPSSKAQPRILTWLRRRIVVPAAMGTRAAQSYGHWATVPPRIQTLAILGFLGLNIAFSVHGYKIFIGNLYFPTVTKQYLRYLSDRTGIISFACFPIVWLFGMRNNLLVQLTGWDFGVFNNFHRWVARIATLQAVVHSVGYTVLILRDGGWEYFGYWWTLWFWWAGQLATVVMCLVFGFSFYWIRRQQYELFLILHIVLSIALLFFMLGHVSIFNGQYDSLFWTPAIIWLADRVLRTARIFAFNLTPWTTHASATYDSSSNILRLTVPTSTSFYTIQPGTHYYLLVLNGLRFWENHPFTVASATNSAAVSSKGLDDEEPLLPQQYVNLDDTDPKAGPSMTFLIRPYDSFTRRLKERAEEHWPSPAPLRLVVEGPYGHTRGLHLFDHVVFIMGGSGIVVATSYLKRLVSSHPRPKSIEIHWAVREGAFAKGVLEDDCASILEQAGHVSVDVYFTSGAEEASLPQAATPHSGRLDARTVVAATAGKAGRESVAVVACGPAVMADQARRAVVERMGVAEGRMEYFEESFQW